MFYIRSSSISSQHHFVPPATTGRCSRACTGRALAPPWAGKNPGRKRGAGVLVMLSSVTAPSITRAAAGDQLSNLDGVIVAQLYWSFGPTCVSIQSMMMSAICRLLLSCMNMWLLPWMPIAGRWI
jgi:hypothetical protein